MTYFIRTGNIFTQTNSNAIDISEGLPAGTYTLKFDAMKGIYYYEMISDFELPSKTYGDLAKNTDRIINTFMNRPSATGVMLTGEKGSGKTLLAKNISKKLIADGVPTIVINSNFCGESFNTFVQTMSQPAVFVFDEFEKIYDEAEQESLLTLFDGVYPTKKLFIVTTNDSWRIDKHMRNRPGRIYYMIGFDGLSVEFVEQYASENLIDKTKVDSLINLSSVFAKFNFDMLKAIVEEMNRYGETAQEVIKILNTKPENEGMQNFTAEIFVIETGEKIDGSEFNDAWEGSPLVHALYFYVYNEKTAPSTDSVDPLTHVLSPASGAKTKGRNKKNSSSRPVKKEEEEEEATIIRFNTGDLESVDGKTGKFVFKNDKYMLLLKKKEKKVFDYSAAF